MSKYIPMDKKLKKEVVDRFEAKYPEAFLLDVKLPGEDVSPVSLVEEVLAHRTIRVVYLSDAWTELIVQGWVTMDIEEVNGVKFGIMREGN